MNERLKVFGGGGLLVLIGFAIAYQFVAPATPKTLRLATGAADGAYQAFGEAYADRLAEDGITLELRPSGGAVDNLKLLADPDSGVDAAFVQGGIVDQPVEGLEALGSVYYEPLWVFTRASARLARFADLAGKRIAVGAEGSGTRALALRVLAETGITPAKATLLPEDAAAAHQALREGRVDAVMTIGSPLSPLVRAMLVDGGLTLMSFDRADAYVLRNRFLTALRLPQGAVDIERDIPAHDVTLLAPAAMLVARDDLSPALASLLLRTAGSVHGDGGLFERPGEFPSPRLVDLPLADEAARFYKSGSPLLQRVLPFWAADLVDRLKVMLVPLVTLLLPLTKILPPAYRWRIRSRIYRWYRDLLDIELAARQAEDAPSRDRLMARLDSIEREVKQISVPLSHADALYSLRMHLGVVRDSLERQGQLSLAPERERVPSLSEAGEGARVGATE